MKAHSFPLRAAAQPPRHCLIMATPHQIFIPALAVLHQPPASCQGWNLIIKNGQERGRQTTKCLGWKGGGTSKPHILP